MIGAETIRWSGRSKPQSSSSQRLNACTVAIVASMSCLSASSTPQANVGSMNTVSRFWLVEHLHPRIAVLVLGMVGHAVDLHQRGRVDALGDLAAEQQIQAARFDDRVERRIGDEVIDLTAHDGQGALAVGEHLHTAALELLGQVPGAGVHRLVVVVVDVDRPVVESHVASSFNGGKLAVSFRRMR